MPIYTLGIQQPKLSPESWIAPNAIVIGDVRIEKNASLWWNCVARGDRDYIHIGEDTNIQDSCILHTNPGMPLSLGKGVTVGHMVVLHGATIGDNRLIGIGSIILNQAVIGKDSIVASNTLIPERKTFPERVMIMGNPGKVVRELTDEEVARQYATAENYVKNFQRYLRELVLIKP